MAYHAVAPVEAVLWFRFRTAATSLIPGTWLLFALTLGEVNLRQRMRKWVWVVLSVFSLPLLFGVVFSKSVLTGDAYLSMSGNWTLPLDWSGYLFNFVVILSVVILMVKMENTLRLTRGIKRWQIKFLILGILGYFFVRVYSASQALLFRSLDMNVEITIAAAVLVLANTLAVVTFVRTRVLPEDIYISGELIARSFVLVAVGGYLIVVGFVAKILSTLREPVSYTAASLVIFMALLLLGAILLSDRVRFILKGAVSRHFKRPRYNYRNIWMTFTEKTASAKDIKDLAGRISSLVSELLEILTVNFLLFGEGKGQALLIGSTSLSESAVLDGSLKESVESLKELLSTRKKPFVLGEGGERLLDELGIKRTMSVEKGNPRYCVPMWAGSKLLGVISLDDRVRWEPLGLEELELLGTVGEQAATSIQNLELVDRLQEARELEALRKFSAFFVHDLKNITTKLSMTLQNFPDYYDNPEFRKDALSLFHQSVDKLKVLSGRMAQLREAPSINPKLEELEKVVTSSLSEIEPPKGVTLMQKHEKISPFAFDGEQISRVITNLAINAVEAVGDKGIIEVRTYRQNGWIVLEIADNGPGVEEEFVATSLFHPFKTTKPNGLGIGLFQCRTIVEAHGGNIAFRNRPEGGATFHVYLPGEHRGNMKPSEPQ